MHSYLIMKFRNTLFGRDTVGVNDMAILDSGMAMKKVAGAVTLGNVTHCGNRRNIHNFKVNAADMLEVIGTVTVKL